MHLFDIASEKEKELTIRPGCKFFVANQQFGWLQSIGNTILETIAATIFHNFIGLYFRLLSPSIQNPNL